MLCGCILLAAMVCPTAAQQKADTIYTFRFKTENDMFYVPWNGNDEELKRLMECVEKYKTEILDGKLPLRVDGYCNSSGSEEENLSVARIRSNRVKSELIIRAGINEACFVTRNHATDGDFVTVRLTVPATAPSEAELEAKRQAEAERLAAERAAQEQARLAEEQRKAEETRRAAAQAEAERLAAEQAEQERAAAQTAAETAGKESRGSWYAGVQGGVPFAVSQFSSFGADKTRAGWSAGIYGGYRFCPVLSLEAQAAWGQANLSDRDCCPDYWLGADGNRYEVAVAGMEGWNYSSLRSRAFMQSYAVQLNVNLLAFFHSTREGRWTLELSPRIAAIGTKATFYTFADDSEVLKGDNRWHFGAGGNLQAGYALTRNLNLGVYTGVTYLTGKPLDGMPGHLHKANYIWESGLKLAWTFSTNRKEASK